MSAPDTALPSTAPPGPDAPDTRSQYREELARFRRFFELSVDAMCTTDTTLVFRDLNPAWEPLLGWTRDELRARSFLEFIHPDDRDASMAEGLRLAAEGGRTLKFVNRYRHKDGHWVTLGWTAAAVDGLIFGTARDVTAEKAQAAELRAREVELEETARRLRALFDGMSEGVVLQDATGQIMECNPAAEQILGLSRDQMMGRRSVDPRWRAIHEDGQAFPGETHPSMVTLRTGEPCSNVLMGVEKADGSRTWISINSRPVIGQGEHMPHGVICTFRDITSERAAKLFAERMASHERLITTGTLAAGVGHEINNPLSYVTANLEYALEELRASPDFMAMPKSREMIEVLSDALEGGDRIRKIVAGLRALARENAPRAPTDVSATLELALSMAMHELRPRAQVIRELTPLPPVLASESQLTQIFVNLLVNAAQSFGTLQIERNRVTVRTSVVGDRVAIEIGDNGPGIGPEVLPRIFDPFFTTKPVGEGTGLGLSISHSLVTALGGEITCQTQVGTGSTFTVFLPVMARIEGSAVIADVRPRVLVIDDEEHVLRAVARLLGPGYDVVTLVDPREALRRLALREPFDLILCDLALPHMSGADLFERACATNPGIASKFAFMTGGLLTSQQRSYFAQLPNRRIDKPFDAQELRDLASAARPALQSHRT